MHMSCLVLLRDCKHSVLDLCLTAKCITNMSPRILDARTAFYTSCIQTANAVAGIDYVLAYGGHN